MLACDRLRSELLGQGSKLQKIWDEGEFLKLFNEDKEVELQHRRYEVHRRLDYQSYLEEEVIFCSECFTPLYP